MRAVDKAIAVFAMISALGLANAAVAETWNGTWAGGFTDADGAQLVFIGDELIGFFWDGDYVSDFRTMPGANGAMTISWSTGTASLSRSAADKAQLVVTPKGKPAVTLALMPE